MHLVGVITCTFHSYTTWAFKDIQLVAKVMVEMAETGKTGRNEGNGLRGTTEMTRAEAKEREKGHLVAESGRAEQWWRVVHRLELRE